MSNEAIETRLVCAETAHSVWLEGRIAIIALMAVLAGAVDFMLHVVWLPTLASQLAVEQLRSDDTIAQALRGVTQWANWSHAILAIFVGVFALVVLYPMTRRRRSAVHSERKTE